MPVGPDDVEAAQGHDGRPILLVLSTEADVGAAPGHVRRDGHGIEGPRPGDDTRLHLVGSGIEHLAADARLSQLLGETIGLLHAGGPHQHRSPCGVHIADLPHQRLLLGLLVREHQVGMIDPDAGPVRRNHHGIEAVALTELLRRRPGRRRHPAHAGVRAQEVRNRDGTEDLPAGPPLHPFLGLQGGLQAVGPVPVLDDPPGELVDAGSCRLAGCSPRRAATARGRGGRSSARSTGGGSPVRGGCHSPGSLRCGRFLPR